MAKKGPGTLCQFFTDQKRSDRLISSLKRFMVPNVGYPWSRDPNFRIDDLPYKPKKGNHILVRSNKYSSEFNKLNKQTKTELLRQRDRILSSSLPVPILTEKPLHLQNSIHSKPVESDQPQMPSKFESSVVTRYWERKSGLPAYRSGTGRAFGMKFFFGGYRKPNFHTLVMYENSVTDNRQRKI